MNAPAQIAVLFKELRITLDSVLTELMNNPKVHSFSGRPGYRKWEHI
jgi:hypothetical protein